MMDMARATGAGEKAKLKTDDFRRNYSEEGKSCEGTIFKEQYKPGKDIGILFAYAGPAAEMLQRYKNHCKRETLPQLPDLDAVILDLKRIADEVSHPC